MTAPVLLTDDLTRQVYVVPERLTKQCTTSEYESCDFWAEPANGNDAIHFLHHTCDGSGRVPVERGDTLELRELGECPNGCGCIEAEDPDARDCACDGPCCYDDYWPIERARRSVLVVWEGPAVRLVRCEGGDECPWPHLAVPENKRQVISVPADLYDELGIGSDPDAWVYLVGEAS